MNFDNVLAGVYSVLTYVFGTPQTFTIVFDDDFVSGNVINADFNTVAIDPVSFDTNHGTTLQALAEAIQKTSPIFKAVVTDDREITVTGVLNENVDVVGPTVTGGASQAEATIATTIEAASIQVIEENQTSPRPGAYATFRLDSIRSIGQDETREIDENFIAQMGGQRVGTVSVNYFGPGAMNQMTRLVNALEKKSIRSSLYSYGVSVLEKMGVVDVTRLLETEWEERASLDFTVGISENYEDDQGVIESVEVSGKIIGAKEGDIDIGPDIVELN